jgi:hypothetical protein
MIMKSFSGPNPLGDPPALPRRQARFDSSGSALHYCQYVMSVQGERCGAELLNNADGRRISA